ncbi:MAG: hypothetical protein FWD71_10810 [Oscillospiraceae bacterium]|nr:hypothetical protein [Oscillospiraceae bacterium]
MIINNTILQILGFIVGSWVLILLIKFGIAQLNKLKEFLIVADKPSLPKHNTKTMLRSLAKYLICLFIAVFCTYKIFAIPMIIIWGFIIFFAVKYIKLWKYHQYSVLLLTSVSCVIIISSVILSPFIRTFFVMLGEVIARF